MDVTSFESFFQALHGIAPFRWQKRLAAEVATGGWNGLIKLPTGAGKTALIDIAVFHMAIAPRRAARRIFFVVDRRLVVDEAYRRAKHIAERLITATNGILAEVADRLREIGDDANSVPLLVKRLRGGIPQERSFIDNPLQPAVVMSTVDQVGSRLLFRGYGVSEFMRPIHAALVGTNSLIILDEAHLSRPFVGTLRWVRRYQESPAWADQIVGSPAQVVEMTATPPPGGQPFGLIQEDEKDDLLSIRLTASKPTKLKEVSTEKEDRGKAARIFAKALAENGLILMDKLSEISNQSPVVGIVANRVRIAHLAWEEITRLAQADAILLTGRMRPLDRAIIEANCYPRMRAGRKPDDNPLPLFVVTTQTIEVGADLDFDGLVTQSAALDALLQRFGRLNRLGLRPWCLGIVLHDKDAPKDDPIYGEALVQTWKHLRPRKGRNPSVDFGSRQIEQFLPQGEQLKPMLSPTRQAPVLMPAHLDMLAQTSPSPAVEPDVALLLHGAGSLAADVHLIWRADIQVPMSKRNERALLATVGILPPTTGEALPMPIGSARRLLSQSDLDDLSDVEGVSGQDTVRQPSKTPVILWHGSESTRSRVGTVADIRPGDTVVLPASYGGLAEIVGVPPLPLDVADQSARMQRGQNLIRLHPALVESWFRQDTPAESKAQAQSIISDLLRGIDDIEAPEAETQAAAATLTSLEGLSPEIGSVLSRLAQACDVHPYPQGGEPTGILLVEPRNTVRSFTDEDDTSSLTTKVMLQDHCRGVGARAWRYAQNLGLPEPLITDIELAGRLHDLGKADPRFQAWLHGGDKQKARHETDLLAKSGQRAMDAAARARARKLANYPSGARHECYSAAFLRANRDLIKGDHKAELVTYLVGVHHGRGRPFMPALEDPGMNVSFNFGGETIEWKGPHSLERLDAGWTDTFWRLTRVYGYWGLALLETIVRLADHRQSAKEMEDGHV